MNITARFLLALLICTMVAACNGKKDFVVSGEVVSADSLISPDKMILILSDVHIIEASMLIGRNEGKEPDGKSELYYQGIFRKYQISQGSQKTLMKKLCLNYTVRFLVCFIMFWLSTNFIGIGN